MGGKKATAGTRQEAPWKGFINWAPSVEERRIIRDYADKGVDTLKLAEDFLSHGYRVGLSFDERDKCMKVSITGVAGADGNVGYTLTLRHASLEVAWVQAWYYCDHLHEWSTWQIPTEGADRFDW